MIYDQRRLRLTGLIRRIGHTYRYVLTPTGSRSRLLHQAAQPPVAPLLAGQSQAPTELTAALRTIDQHVDSYFARARLT
jgi:hypothetical protein